MEVKAKLTQNPDKLGRAVASWKRQEEAPEGGTATVLGTLSSGFKFQTTWLWDPVIPTHFLKIYLLLYVSTL